MLARNEGQNWGSCSDECVRRCFHRHLRRCADECEQHCAEGAILELTTFHVVVKKLNLTVRHVQSVLDGSADDNDIMYEFEWPEDVEGQQGDYVAHPAIGRRLEVRRAGIRRLAGALDTLSNVLNPSNTKLELNMGIIKQWEKLWGSEGTVGAFAQIILKDTLGVKLG